MSRNENQPISTSSVHIEPFVYPGVPVPVFSRQQLAETESWASRVARSSVRLWNYQAMPESRNHYLAWLTQRVREEDQAVERLLTETAGRPVDPLPPGSWQQQTNPYGMWTCAVISAINALHFIHSQYAPHQEETLLKALGYENSQTAESFAHVHGSGIPIEEVIPALRRVAPDVEVDGSNSVAAMLKAGKDGAAILFPLSENHAAVIPPGQRIYRDRGVAYVQVADPLQKEPQSVPIARLIKSNIITSDDPHTTENGVVIVRKKGIRTVSVRRR